MSYSKDSVEVAWAIYDLIECGQLGVTAEVMKSIESLAGAIDELLKNLLLAPVDHYTVK